MFYKQGIANVISLNIFPCNFYRVPINLYCHYAWGSVCSLFQIMITPFIKSLSKLRKGRNLFSSFYLSPYNCIICYVICRGRPRIRWRNNLDNFKKNWIKLTSDKEAWNINGEFFAQNKGRKRQQKKGFICVMYIRQRGSYGICLYYIHERIRDDQVVFINCNRYCSNYDTRCQLGIYT